MSPSISLFIYLSNYLFHFLSITFCLFLALSVCLSVCLSISVRLFQFVYFSTSSYCRRHSHPTLIFAIPSNIHFIVLLFNFISELKLLCRIAERVFSRGDVAIQSVSICNLATLLLGMLRTYTTSRKVRTFIK